ncbi:MAG: MazG nucleotide pyrophosphohydrolase domain-containing protein, partial [Rothia aeria]
MNEDKASEKDVAEVAARAGRAFERLVHTMATLRAPGGCPWDAEQTHQSLIRFLIEESYEVVEAVEAPEGTNLQLLREELGDVLLQVLFHADIAAAARSNRRQTPAAKSTHQTHRTFGRAKYSSSVPETMPNL